MFEIVLAVVLTLILGMYIKSIQFSTRNLPPGPFMWPFGLGIIPTGAYQLRLVPTLHNIKNARPWEYFHLMAKKYGDFYSVQAGNFMGVVVASHEVMQELAPMEEYSIKVSHRLFTYPRTFNKELGLIFVSSPEIWQEMRKFTQRTLREFGFGKRHTMQSAVEEEVQELIQEIGNIAGENGGCMKIRTVFVISVLNVLWCCVAGKRYAHNDPVLVKLMKMNFEVTKSTTFTEPLQTIAPWIKHVFPWLVKEDLRQRAYDSCHEFTKQLVDERKATGDYLKEPQSYIDVFLKKIEENENNEKSIYTEQQLQSMLEDLLQTGSATTNGTLNYGLLFLTLNPAIQNRCREEIRQHVPRHSLPTPEDIEKMPFFQAFVLETHRLGNVVPNPIPRIVPCDWTYKGYKIPKGTYIVSNHYSVHMDEKYWKDPETFRPQRFINEKGEFVEDKRVVHFGYGKRICIGITLANHVISVFLASLIQNFEFSVVPNEDPPSTEPEIGVSLSPMEYSVWVKPIKRENCDKLID